MSVQIEREDGTVFVFDGMIRWDTPIRVQLSSLPLEAGAPVTDHVQRLADVYTLVAIHTTTPANPGSGPIGNARLNAMRDFLAGSIAQVCELTVPREGVFSQMLLGSYSYSTDSVGRAEVTMQWQRAEFATAQLVTIPAPVASVEPQMSDEQDAGTQSPESVEATESEGSLLSQIFGVF